MTDSDTLHPTHAATAILVGTRNKSQSKEQISSQLKELSELGIGLGLRTVAQFSQYLERVHSATLIGKGKIEEIENCLRDHPGAVLLFDDNLSPTQLRNLEKKLNTRIYDRSLLILETFLYRAQTSQAKLQVNLARYEYLLPRLTRRWTHLERQRGGLGARSGSGEKEIETDRRQIRNQISSLKKKLLSIEKQGQTQRKSRHHLIRIALLGYTNVGKSTLMNALSRSNVEVEDKPFATLNTTVRQLYLGNRSCLLSDTVGFIHKLPHSLIESFKSTLAELTEADLLLHVADISHPDIENQLKVVEDTLQEIGIKHTPMILVLNKADLWYKQHTDEFIPTIDEQSEALPTTYPYLSRYYGSACDPIYIQKLKEVLSQRIQSLFFENKRHTYT